MIGQENSPPKLSMLQSPRKIGFPRASLYIFSYCLTVCKGIDTVCGVAESPEEFERARMHKALGCHKYKGDMGVCSTNEGGGGNPCTGGEIL
jgi:hypothetical protein